jgi:hypothetical protein
LYIVPFREEQSVAFTADVVVGCAVEVEGVVELNCVVETDPAEAELTFELLHRIYAGKLTVRKR